jgi:RimJ/RimL family protein N-acetyltransferase
MARRAGAFRLQRGDLLPITTIESLIARISIFWGYRWMPCRPPLARIQGSMRRPSIGHCKRPKAVSNSIALIACDEFESGFEKPTVIIDTPRTRLRCWGEADRDAFATMNADPEVMLDQGGPLSREKSDAKLNRYAAAFGQYGFCRWVVESREGNFLGYAGIMPASPGHPLGPHIEIGWRLVRRAWGYGYATEAAGAALKDAFERAGLTEVLAYTAPDNFRSQAVMARLHLQRDSSRDFTADYDSIQAWRGLVWVGRRAA